ncbi:MULTISPECIES: lytic transglycosylase domain-containing protein [unclassified Pseudomonas]|uniref:lytic transglycosylase domain-containing protein n=1 Tax=unclassified Pseudomonas TaxID=196821 RepID=UPI002AB3F0C8|nr:MULTISPECIES: lytic transglycosylase domain-containing protein [unclassified Pseudomonas]MDY7563424.1 lytic transglycosylase domain-containing protein [Pseudomonas sp. AB6]MEA9980007.1 lytic transglycosylase domain-containing protein [Pseudomonas sp. RTS4]MEA9996494.1 lytic transglycosylase domain-containing protein [Pseudomonas sp. AA4]MEB0198164.1 lytic transglycosylase domain-containing protein [Pseudomonas sp. 5S4]MEB0213491.1 lytic transglycosylase domain-containing protein [Pseudomona
MRSVWFYLVLLMPLPASAFCFQEAGQRYKVDPILLEAIGIHESKLQQHAVNRNVDASGKLLSTDYGVMQINTDNANHLIRMGLIRRPADLLADACFNVQAGAWVLARHLRVCGNTWRCLGSYNAGFHPSAVQEKKRLRYAQEIRTIYNRLKALGPTPANLAIR